MRGGGEEEKKAWIYSDQRCVQPAPEALNASTFPMRCGQLLQNMCATVLTDLAP